MNSFLSPLNYNLACKQMKIKKFDRISIVRSNSMKILHKNTKISETNNLDFTRNVAFTDVNLKFVKFAKNW